VIPSTPVGVALLLVLIAPGLAYVLRREKVVPTGPRTAFREALQVVFVSVVSLTVVAVLAALMRSLAPGHTPDVRGLIRDPGPFFRDHHVHLSWWAIGLLTTATLLAWLAADPRVIDATERWSRGRALRWLTGSGEEDIADVSGWWQAFQKQRPADTATTNVGVLKDDGTYVQGTLLSWTAGGLDYDKRELILTAPLIYQTTDGLQHPMEVQMVVIAGRNISRLDVIHLPRTAEQPIETTEKAVTSIDNLDEATA
jgi:hypothetical protein